MPLRKWISRFLLTLFIATVALWAGSYARFYYRAPSSLFAAERGCLQILFRSTPWEQEEDSIAFRMGLHRMGYRGFNTRWWPAYRAASSYWLVYIPLWIPAIFFVPAFAYAYRPYRRYKKRKRLGLCLSCGYNLRGNESGTCPECGTLTTPPEIS